MKGKLKYFVAYVIPAEIGFNVGHMVLTSEGMLKSEEDILRLQKVIAEQNGVEKAVILNFKRLRA